jgi:hypothetical protein
MTAVLIIDRDFETRLVARRVLEPAGFTVSTAAGDGYLPRGYSTLSSPICRKSTLAIYRGAIRRCGC